MNLKPLYDRVVVKREDEEKTTAGGIVLPGSATEKPAQGVVVAVGSGKVKHGETYPLTVKVGDRVLFGKFTGSEVKVDGVEYLIMREEEIFAIIQ
ncbi:MAG: co-chaperone GroES [Cardiobacteriaceae bacterium]|nr:co-chaperone GroES [Cardiobacteriaceae bacterium]